MPRLICTCVQKEVEDVRVLDYRHCSLKDVPSDVFNWERTLEELYVDANQIKILPRELFYCHGLKKLFISDNEITSIPPAIASLVNLEQVDISKNGILDLPEDIKCCKYIRSIEASVNPLGKLPDGFTLLLNLTQLYLNDTFLDYLPGNFGRLSKLKILEVRENHLKTLPKSMCRLTELERLDIGNNDFTEMPEVVGSLTGLLELWCDSNQITTVIPEIGNLKQLMYLDASKNRVDRLPPEIEGCLSLSDLHLSTNLLRELPETLGRLSNLTTLKLDDNQLESLPFTVGGLASLSELNISANDLEELPASIGLLRCLRTLYADENLLIDLPPELGSCTGLTVLSLRSNKLTYIPDEIGHIPRLRVLNLSDNELQCLPFDLTKLKQLQALWLAENQSKPLIRLQTELDNETGKRSLTCYLLPQQKINPDGQTSKAFGDDAQSFHPSMWDEERLQRQQIHFDFGDQSDHEDKDGKTIRPPTPYPKENKEKQRHARNLAMRQVTSGNDDIQWNTKTQTMEKRQTEGSGEGDKGRGRRSRSGSRDDLDEAGQKVSPLQEMHKLYKADKEKLLKDKERIQRQKSVSPEPTPEVKAEKPISPKQKTKTRDASPPKTLKTDNKENKPTADKTKKKDKDKVKSPNAEDDDGGFLQARGDRKPGGAVYRSDSDLARAQNAPNVLSPNRSVNYWQNPPPKAPSVAASDFAMYSGERRHHHHGNYLRGGYPRHRHRHHDYESDTASVGYRSDYDFHGRRRDGYSSDRDGVRSERNYAGYGSDIDTRSTRSSGVAGHPHHLGASPAQPAAPRGGPYNRRTTIRNDELYAQPMSSLAATPEGGDGKQEASDSEMTPNWKNQLYAVLEQRRKERSRKSQDGSSSRKGLPPYQGAPPYGTPPAYRARRRGVMSDSGVSPNYGRTLLAEFGPSTARVNADTQSERRNSSDVGTLNESRDENLPKVPYHPPPQYRRPEPQRLHGHQDSSVLNPPEHPFQHYKSMPSIPLGGNPTDGTVDQNSDGSVPIARTSSERTFQLFLHPPGGDTANSSSVEKTPLYSTSLAPGATSSPLLSRGAQKYDGRPHDARPYGSESTNQSNYMEHSTLIADGNLNKHPAHGALQSRADISGARNTSFQAYSLTKGLNPQRQSNRDYEHIDALSTNSNSGIQPPPASSPSRLAYEPPPMFSTSSSSFSVPTPQFHDTPPPQFHEAPPPQFHAAPPSHQFHEPPPVNGPYDMERFEDVAKYKSHDPNSQVSSSTDSGYGHGHHIYERVERLTGYPPGMMPPPNRAPPPLTSPSPLSIVPPPDRDPPSLPTSRETTPSRNLDSGHGSMDQQDMMGSLPIVNKSNLLSVVIQKSPGLGFSIAGGVNSPGNPFRDNDLGIFVTKVQQGGPASRALRPGDKIIEVNGIDFTHIVHDQAVGALKASGQTVSMLIERKGITATTI